MCHPYSFVTRQANRKSKTYILFRLLVPVLIGITRYLLNKVFPGIPVDCPDVYITLQMCRNEVETVYTVSHSESLRRFMDKIALTPN